jgi:hypothetical protein
MSFTHPQMQMEQTPANHFEPPMTIDGRIASSAPYAQLATSRLCGDGVGACALRFLCTRCGINDTMAMHSVSKENRVGADDREMQEKLQFKSIGCNKQQIIMPPIIVIDAVSILRASQRKAVVPGGGLDGPIRPLQGPVCKDCCDKSMSKRSLPPSPRDVDSFTTSDFTTRHGDLLKSIEALTISSSGTIDDASDFVMSEACECAHSTSLTSCSNMRETKLEKSTAVFTDPYFSLVFGHMSSSKSIEATGGYDKDDTQTEDKVYEICIVDTRHQRMCHIAVDGSVKSGLSGQFNYYNTVHACDDPGVVVEATLVNPVTESAMPAAVVGVTPVVMATCGTYNPTPKMLMPPPKASCFVCCTLLEEEEDDSSSGGYSFHRSVYNRPRHTSVYLKSHSNWVHKDCTVQCEKRKHGVCMGMCPRLNTLVSTQFDETPRFENVCTACVNFERKAPVTPFSSIFKKSNVYSSAYTSSLSVKSTNMKREVSAKKSSSKNWLTDAGSLRKKAATNLANLKMTQKEIDASSFSSFKVDKSGIYNDKVRGTWYTLDRDGKNPMPVCDLPFWDTFFNDKRTWSTLGERAQAISSYEHLVEMRDM